MYIPVGNRHLPKKQIYQVSEAMSGQPDPIQNSDSPEKTEEKEKSEIPKIPKTPQKPQTAQPPDHYFTPQTKAPTKVKKLFLSVANQSMSLQTAPKVFSPETIDKGTQILLENLLFLDPARTKTILDLGAGYGPVSIWLNKKYALDQQLSFNPSPIPQIYASEVNDRAVWLLNRNLIANDCQAIEVLKGDFLSFKSWLDENNIMFDVIYSNPPLKIGHEKLLQIFDLAMSHLQPDGFIQYVHKKKLGAPGLLKKIKAAHPTWQTAVYKKSGGFHVIVLAPTQLPFDTNRPTIGGYF